MDFSQGRLHPIQDHAAVLVPHDDTVAVLGGRKESGDESPVNRWHRLEMGPLKVTTRLAEARVYGNAAVYEEAGERRRLLIFGGASQGSRATNQLWEMDLRDGIEGARLKSVAVRGDKPGARFEHAAAYDPQRGWLIVYGGLGVGGQVINESRTWAFDTNSYRWLALEGASVGPRAGAVMAYDSRHQTMILVGGHSRDETNVKGDAYYLECSDEGQPTPTASATATSAATVTATASPTAASASATATASCTVAATPPLHTATPTQSATHTLPATPTAPATSSATSRASVSATATPSHPSGPAPVYLPLVMRHHEEPTSIFGVQISEARFRDPALLAHTRGVGANWWRTFLFWDEVEPTRTSPPSYDWRHYDALFGNASELGLETIAEIQGNPTWAADFPGGPPYDLDTLTRFVAEAVERYDGDGVRDAPGSPRVRYWELYNEPDNTDAKLAREGRGWGYWGYEGARYGQMLKRVYTAAKIANPDAQIVFGGVAYDCFVPDCGPFNPEFIDDVLREGAGPYFDVMNFHYYPAYRWRWDRYGPDIIGKTVAVKQKLAEYGLSKPTIVTEAGYWSEAYAPFFPPSSLDEQARYVPQLYARGIAAGLELVCWYQYDDVPGFDNPARGLLDGSLQPKPSFEAFRQAAAILAVARPESARPDPDAEGEVYWFRSYGSPLAVAWTNDGETATLEVEAPAAERIHYMGSRVVARDESDGRLDGITRIPYGADPIYVRPLGAAP